MSEGIMLMLFHKGMLTVKFTFGRMNAKVGHTQWKLVA